MTRTEVWFWLVCGGAVYQVLKLNLGYAVDFEDVFDCAWWAGVALLWHWQSNKNSLPLKTAER